MSGNRHRTAATAFALLAGLGMASQAAPARAAFPGQNGVIAWSRLFLTTDAEIYGIRPNGRGERQISHNTRNDFGPAWASDGRRIAYGSSTASDVDVYVLSTVDWTETNVTNDPGNADVEPAWSPSGGQIAISRQSPFTGLGAIWVVDLNGRDPVRLTETTTVNHQPAWSPDGQWIVFASDRDGNSELYRIHPDGTGEQRLTFTATTHEENPNWSADGTRIAFDSCEAPSFPCPGSPNYEIFSINADGTGLTQLTDAAGIDANPAWAPDGTRLVFRSDRTGETQLWTMKADGSSPTQLTFEPFEGGVDPDWQPRP